MTMLDFLDESVKWYHDSATECCLETPYSSMTEPYWDCSMDQQLRESPESWSDVRQQLSPFGGFSYNNEQSFYGQPNSPLSCTTDSKDWTLAELNDTAVYVEDNELLDDIVTIIAEEEIHNDLAINPQSSGPAMSTCHASSSLMDVKTEPVAGCSREESYEECVLALPRTIENTDDLSLMSDDDDGYSSSDEDLFTGSSSSQLRVQGHGHSSFWHYNSQLKGPRGERFELNVASPTDPHQPIIFRDPVFDSSQRVRVSHVGKARKGDGNDITPNPKKLCNIGKQLDKLNLTMAQLSAAGESKAVKKEKNKLASRACRLKKKAHHEANKVKLDALEKEQQELNSVIFEIKQDICNQETTGHKSALTDKLNELLERYWHTKAAGRTSEYVDDVVRLSNEGNKVKATGID